MLTKNKINYKDLQERILNYIVSGSACFIFAISFSVITLWFIHDIFYILFDQTFYQMKFNTAISFIACSIALIAVLYEKKKTAIIAGFFISLVGILSLTEYLTDIKFGIDELFVKDLFDPNNPYPGRMAPNSSSAFILTGLLIIFVNTYVLSNIKTFVTLLLCFAIFVFGNTGLIAHLFGVNALYSWGSYTQMSPQTALCFILFSIGVFAFTYKKHLTKISGSQIILPEILSSFLPLIIFLFFTTASFFLHDQLRSKELDYIKTLSEQNAEKTSALLNSQINSKLSALDRMAKRWDAAEGTPRDVWNIDADNYIKNLSGLKKLEWVDKKYNLHWSRSSKGNKEIDRANAANYQKYKSTLKRSEIKSESTILIINNSIFAALIPLKVNDKFDGFIVGTFSIKDLFGEILTKDFNKNYNISIDYNGINRFRNNNASAIFDSKWRVQQKIQIYDQEWLLKATPTLAFVKSLQTSLPIIVLISSLIISALSSISIWFILTLRAKSDYLKQSNQQIKEYAQKLVDSETNYQKLIDGVSDYAIYFLDLSGNVQTWNNGANNIKQYKADEIIGHNFSIFYTEEDRKKGLPQRDLESATSNGTFNIEGWRVRKDGSKFWANSTISAIYDQNKKVSGFAKVTRDETEREEFEKRILNSEERYDLAVQGMSVGLWDWNITSNELYWSDKFKEIMGVGKDFKANYEEFSNRLHPEDKAFVEKMLFDHIEGKCPYDVEYRLRHDNGEYIWIHASGQAKWGEDGKAIHMSGSVDNISNRKKIEEERAKLISIVEESIDYIGIADLEGNLQYHNRSARRMIGLDDNYDLSKLKISDMHPKWAADLILKEAIPTVLKYGHWQGESALMHKNGTEIPVSQTLSLNRDAKGNPVCFTTIMRDITERKKVDQLKSEFISTVSHELRTPLTSIRGSLGLIIGKFAKDLPDKVMGLLNIAYDNCERLIPLINDILDLDKISSGKMRFDIKKESLEKITKQAVDSNQSYAEKFGVSIELKPIDKDIEIEIDAARYIQILANLLSNAAKFSPQDKTIDVFTTKLKDRVRISVQDYGSGIPEDFRSRIFSKFSQADSSSSRAKSGTGLGLHITKMMTESMGGEIGFETKIDEGTIFWVEFPIVKQQNESNTLKYL